MRSLLLLTLFGSLVGCSKDPPPPVAVDVKTPDGEVQVPAEEKSTLPAWVKELSKQSPEKQLAAIDAIIQISKVGDDVIPALVGALKDRGNAGAGMHFVNKPNSTREAVVLCLIKLGPKGEAALTGKALPVIQAALGDPDADVREHAAWSLTHLKDKAKPAQKDLLKLLADEERLTRYAAYMALQETGFDQAGEVVKLLKHMNPGVRGDAAEAVAAGWLGVPSPAELPTLIDALKDEDPFVSKTAAEAIGGLGPKAKEAVPALIEIVKGTTEEQLKKASLTDLAAMLALRRIGEPAVPELVKLLGAKNFLARYQAAIALGLIGPPAKEALEPLAELMKTERESADVAIEAAAAQVTIGGDAKAPLEYLTGLLDRNDLPLNVRGRTIATLARFGPKAEPAVPELVKLLKSEEPLIRQAVVVALKNMGTGAKAAVPALGVLLSDEELSLRLAAAEILKGLGPAAKPAIPDLAKALSDTDDAVRRMAAETLTAFGPEAKDAVPELAKALVNKEYKVGERVASAEALAAIGPDAAEAVPSLIEVLTTRGDPSLAPAAAKAIGRIGPAAKDAVPKLIERAQKSSYGGEQNAAMLALGLIGPEASAAIEPLKAKFAKSMSEQRIWAAAALARITPADAKLYVPAVLEALADKSTRPSNVLLRSAALESLELLGPLGKDSVNDLVGLLREPKPEVRIQGIRGLAFVTTDGKATVPPLVRMLNDKEVKVRLAAIRALGQIGPRAVDASKRLKEIAGSATQLSAEARAALERIEK